MEKIDLIKRLQLLQAHPDFAKPLDPLEIQELFIMFLKKISELELELKRK
jgi:hypothetical protein